MIVTTVGKVAGVLFESNMNACPDWTAPGHGHYCYCMYCPSMEDIHTRGGQNPTFTSSDIAPDARRLQGGLYIVTASLLLDIPTRE
jgi:hypothetical protein